MTTTPPVEHAWTIAPGRTLPLDRPRVMTILNVTPDSFFDGGQLTDPLVVADAAARALSEGADLLDIGGESTRPGAVRVSDDEQARRVVPAIQAVRASGIELPITIDTTSSKVARAALDAGATAINDVSGAEDDPAILRLAAERGVGVVLMHRLRPPEADTYSDRYQAAPVYERGVVNAVKESLTHKRDAAIGAGVAPHAIVLDPGLGFGKTVPQNLDLIGATGDLLGLGCPVLSGLSRKSFVGRVSHPARDVTEPHERLAGTIALSVLHLQRGARVFRVHDTGPMREALDAGWALIDRTQAPAPA